MGSGHISLLASQFFRAPFSACCRAVSGRWRTGIRSSEHQSFASWLHPAIPFLFWFAAKFLSLLSAYFLSLILHCQAFRASELDEPPVLLRWSPSFQTWSSCQTLGCLQDFHLSEILLMILRPSGHGSFIASCLEDLDWRCDNSYSQLTWLDWTVQLKESSPITSLGLVNAQLFRPYSRWHHVCARVLCCVAIK